MPPFSTQSRGSLEGIFGSSNGCLPRSIVCSPSITLRPSQLTSSTLHARVWSSARFDLLRAPITVAALGSCSIPVKLDWEPVEFPVHFPTLLHTLLPYLRGLRLECVF